MGKSTFAGLRVAAFESRMAKEMTDLIGRYGGEPLVAPSMREVPLEDNTQALEFGKQLLAGQFNMLVLLTGVGTRALVEVLQTQHSLEAIKAALGGITLVVRGPKPVAALKELRLTATITVPEPNTWRDILQALDENHPVHGLQVAVQEYGISNPEFLNELRGRGADVTRVPVYRWALPEDTGPLRHVLDEVLGGRVHVMLVTSATQIDNVMQMLDSDNQAESFRQATRTMVVASIGPVASERLRGYDVSVDLEPSHPKMGILVKETSERAQEILRTKR